MGKKEGFEDEKWVAGRGGRDWGGGRMIVVDKAGIGRIRSKVEAAEIDLGMCRRVTVWRLC